MYFAEFLHMNKHGPVKIELVVIWSHVVERYLKISGVEQNGLDESIMDSTAPPTDYRNGKVEDVAIIEKEDWILFTLCKLLGHHRTMQYNYQYCLLFFF